MNKMVKNASWIIAGKIAQSALSFVVSLLTARYLGPGNYGLLNYASSLVIFVTPIMTLGLTGTLVQEFINHPEDEGKIMGTSLLSCFATSFLCMLGVIGFSFIANPNEPTTVIVCALYSLLLIVQALEISQYWFQAKLLSKYTSIVSLAAYIAVSAYKIYLLWSGKSIYWFAVSYALDYLIISVGQLYFYKKLGGKKLEFSFKTAKELFNRSRHYIVSNMMVTVFAQTGNILLKLMLDETATGFFSAATVLAGITSFVFAAIIDSFRPAIFQSKAVNEEAYQMNIKRLYSVVIYLALAQSIGMTVLSAFIINLTYGADYAPATVVLQIVVWQMVFSYLGQIRNIWILAEEKQKYLWIINAAGAIANILLNLVLIPLMGVAGAAVAAVATQFFTNVVMSWIVRPVAPVNRLLLESLNPKILKDMVFNIILHK